MFFKKEVSSDEIVLQVSGSLNGEPANEFQQHLQQLADGGYRTITLDLREVSSINSACIGRILLYRKKLATGERVIRIRGCSDPLYTTFQMIEFDKLLSIQR